MGFRETFCHLAETRGVMAEISRQTGISKAILCRYKDGVAPSFDNAIRIADFFGVSLDWLAGRSADPVLHAGDDRAARVILASYEVMGPGWPGGLSRPSPRAWRSTPRIGTRSPPPGSATDEGWALRDPGPGLV